MDYQRICEKVQQVARNAGVFIRGERIKISAGDVETKSAASFVTYVDKAAEKMIDRKSVV